MNDQVEFAIQRIMSEFDPIRPNLELLVRRELELMYETGKNQPLVEQDKKMGELVAAVKRGTDFGYQLKRERDAVLEEYARDAWRQVMLGMLRSGLHPPYFHTDPRYNKRLHGTTCKNCKKDMIPWGKLDKQDKELKMKATFTAIMQTRAKRLIAQDADEQVPVEQAPTTHEIAGVAQPVLPPDIEKEEKGQEEA